jgi:hypothetical protein
LFQLKEVSEAADLPIMHATVATDQEVAKKLEALEQHEWAFQAVESAACGAVAREHVQVS